MKIVWFSFSTQRDILSGEHYFRVLCRYIAHEILRLLSFGLNPSKKIWEIRSKTYSLRQINAWEVIDLIGTIGKFQDDFEIYDINSKAFDIFSRQTFAYIIIRESWSSTRVKMFGY